MASLGCNKTPGPKERADSERGIEETQERMVQARLVFLFDHPVDGLMMLRVYSNSDESKVEIGKLRGGGNEVVDKDVDRKEMGIFLEELKRLELKKLPYFPLGGSGVVTGVSGEIEGVQVSYVHRSSDREEFAGIRAEVMRFYEGFRGAD